MSSYASNLNTNQSVKAPLVGREKDPAAIKVAASRAQ